MVSQFVKPATPLLSGPTDPLETDQIVFDEKQQQKEIATKKNCITCFKRVKKFAKF